LIFYFLCKKEIIILDIKPKPYEITLTEPIQINEQLKEIPQILDFSEKYIKSVWRSDLILNTVSIDLHIDKNKKISETYVTSFFYKEAVSIRGKYDASAKLTIDLDSSEILTLNSDYDTSKILIGSNSYCDYKRWNINIIYAVNLSLDIINQNIFDYYDTLRFIILCNSQSWTVRILPGDNDNTFSEELYRVKIDPIDITVELISIL